MILGNHSRYGDFSKIGRQGEGKLKHAHHEWERASYLTDMPARKSTELLEYGFDALKSTTDTP
jgi:hypothetical protein